MAYRHFRHKLLGPFWYPHSNIKTTIIAWQSRGWRWCRHQNYISTGIAADLGLKRFAKTRHWALVQLSSGFGTSKHSLRAQEKQRLQQHNSGAFSARQRLQHDKASMSLSMSCVCWIRDLGLSASASKSWSSMVTGHSDLDYHDD